MKMTIKILHEQHYIEGDEYSAFLILDAGEHTIEMPLAVHKKQNEFFDFVDSLSGIQWRLEQLGNTVRTVNKFVPDPNFDSLDEAENYLTNKTTTL